LAVHQRFHIHNWTVIQLGKEGSEVELDGKAREGIWRVEGEIYKRTSVRREK